MVDENEHEHARRAPRQFLRRAVWVYGVISASTVIAAHLLEICAPESGLGGRLIAPVSRALEFVDAHWKATLILLLPVVGPTMLDLVKRLKRFAEFEFHGPPDLKAESPKLKRRSGDPGSEP